MTNTKLFIDKLKEYKINKKDRINKNKKGPNNFLNILEQKKHN